MTIIVYDGKTIAADRQATTESVISGFVKKLEIYKGGIFACTGSMTDGPKFKLWLEKNTACNLSKQFNALFTRTGKVYIANHKLEVWEAFIPSAIGSSWEAAEMLVRSGMSAKEAVRLICKYDIMCSGKVDSVNV